MWSKGIRLLNGRRIHRPELVVALGEVSIRLWRVVQQQFQQPLAAVRVLLAGWEVDRAGMPAVICGLAPQAGAHHRDPIKGERRLLDTSLELGGDGVEHARPGPGRLQAPWAHR